MATRKRRSTWWLLAAAILLVAGAWLMFSGDPVIPETRDFTLPVRMRAKERERSDDRRTLISLPPLSDAGVPLAAPPPPRDPVLALMPATVEHGAVVAEFNAIVNSDLGGLMLQCLFDGDETALGALRDAGLDPTTAIDRVAFIDDALVVTGHFKGDPWRVFQPSQPLTRDWGRQGKVYEWPLPDGGAEVMGSWGGQLLVTGSKESVEHALDRLETTGPRPEGVLSESDAYGEVYGMLGPEVLAQMVAPDDEVLAQTVRQAASRVTLHADVQHDVGLVADITGTDSTNTESLRRSLGGALAAARVQAQAKGRADQLELFDAARVSRADDGKFRLTAGLPYDFMARVFTRCVDQKRNRRAARADAGVEPADE